MATDWVAEQISAYNDIKEEGFSVVVRKPGSPGEFDPDTMEWIDPTESVDVSTFAVRVAYKISEVDGTIIQRGDSYLIIPAYGLPADFDTTYQVLIGSDVQNVINVDPVSPRYVHLLFNLEVRE